MTADIYELFKSYVKEEHLEDFLPTEQSQMNVMEPMESKEKTNNYLGANFVNDLLNLIEAASSGEALQQNLLLLLEKHKDSPSINKYLIVAGVAVDSYNYWKDEVPRTRSAVSNIARIAKADALSAAAFICESGFVALFTSATPPGAAAIAGTAAFGSAVEGATMLFE